MKDDINTKIGEVKKEILTTEREIKKIDVNINRLKGERRKARNKIKKAMQIMDELKKELYDSR